MGQWLQKLLGLTRMYWWFFFFYWLLVDMQRAEQPAAGALQMRLISDRWIHNTLIHTHEGWYSRYSTVSSSNNDCTNLLQYRLCVYSLITYYFFVQWSSTVVLTIKKQKRLTSSLHWVACSFFIMNDLAPDNQKKMEGWTESEGRDSFEWLPSAFCCLSSTPGPPLYLFGGW